MPVKPLKSAKKRLGTSKPLPSFRTMTMVKGPGTLASFKLPVDSEAEDDRKDRRRDD